MPGAGTPSCTVSATTRLQAGSHAARSCSTTAGGRQKRHNTIITPSPAVKTVELCGRLRWTEAPASLCRQQHQAQGIACCLTALMPAKHCRHHNTQHAHSKLLQAASTCYLPSSGLSERLSCTEASSQAAIGCHLSESECHPAAILKSKLSAA